MDRHKLKLYYQLTKPGIIYGNTLAAVAGVLFASRGTINAGILLGLVIGLALVIGSACVFNNIIDRKIDKKMSRTKKRALVTGEISVKSAQIYGTILGVIGFALLLLTTNWLAAALGAFAMIFYLFAYGYAKRKSIHGTLVGAVPGAIPPVAGYVAVTGNIDLAAWLIFLVLITWQLPHFYSIAVYRRKEYEAADIPILSVKKGLVVTKRQIITYIFLFIVATMLLTYFSYTGLIFAGIMLAMGLFWMKQAIEGLNTKDSEKWARGMFSFSLRVLLAFCILLSVDAWLA